MTDEPKMMAHITAHGYEVNSLGDILFYEDGEYTSAFRSGAWTSVKVANVYIGKGASMKEFVVEVVT